MKRILGIVIIVITLFSCKKEISTETSQIQKPDVFTGYKVASNARQIGTEYWENTNVISDLMIGVFQKNFEVFPLPQGDAYCVWTQAICNGDFNNDGYIDIFNAGTAYNGKKANLSFLIWNASLLKFEEKNLINDKTDFIGAPTKVSPIYLNNDNYVDLIIHGHSDEGKPNSNEPTTMCISDGKGGYDLVKLELEPKEILDRLAHEHGDVADLNGDKLPDLLIAANTKIYIFWGSISYPYFTNKDYLTIDSDCAFYSKIKDVNTDGYNDILIGTNVKNRILINNGDGTFKDRNIQYSSVLTNAINVFDYIVDDLNKDGFKDIINISATHHKNWTINVYIQNRNEEFDKDNNWVEYTINLNRENSDYKNKIIYYDFDGDGFKDITYSDSGLNPYTKSNNEIKRKSIFLRRGNKFIEESFYNYDKYAKELKEKYYDLY